MNLPQDTIDMAADRYAHQVSEGTGTFEFPPSLPKQGQKRWAPKVKTGCLTCRRRRIKCDETKPICKRCTKSTYHCEGYDDAHNASEQPYVAAAQGSPSGLRLPLHNANDRVSCTLLYFLDSTHPGYGLESWRPNLLKQLPQRMGYSEVFDTSVATFISLLKTLHLPSSFQQPTHTSRQLYISSIKGLQKALATPKARYRASTVYSAYILAQCHVWMCHNSTISRGHGEGLSHLVSVMLVQNPKDPFLLGLCYAITSELLEGAVFNPNIQLLPWIQTLYNMPETRLGGNPAYPASKPTLPRFNLALLSIMPDLMRCPRENKQRIQSAYDYIIAAYLLVRKCVEANMESPYFDTFDAMRCNQIHAAYTGIGITLNAFLRAFNSSDALLSRQKVIFCAEAITLAERAMQERPLSAHHVPEALLAAWCVADGDVKARLRQLLEDYRETFAMAKLIQNVASWQEAPDQIQEIPWFTLYNGGEDSYKGTERARPMAEAIERLTEYCCIL